MGKLNMKDWIDQTIQNKNDRNSYHDTSGH